MASSSSSWPFCPQCGTVMDPPTSHENVTCSCCKFSCRFAQLAIPEVTTKSAPTSKPAWLIDYEEKDKAGQDKHAIIEEPCPKCANPEMFFYTMQLRSVDEGSTVFYECPKCEHKFSVNNWPRSLKLRAPSTYVFHSCIRSIITNTTHTNTPKKNPIWMQYF